MHDVHLLELLVSVLIPLLLVATVRQLEFSSDSRGSLDSMMGTLRTGNSADFVSPLIPPGLSDAEKQLARDKIGRSIFDYCQLGDLSEGLRGIEAGKVWQFGGMSRRPASNLDQTAGDSMDKQAHRFYAVPYQCSIDSDAMNYAIQAVTACIRPDELLRPLQPEEVADSFPNSGMGFPIVSSQPCHKPRALSIAKEIWESGADPAWVDELPAIGGYRGQPRGRKNPTDPVPPWFAKTRLIFMMPRASAIVVQCVRKPLFDSTRRKKHFCAWNSPHDVDVEMTRLLAENVPIMSTDFKGFDQSVPFEVIDIVFDMIKSWFVREAGPLIEFCRMEFKGTGLIMPGRFYPGSDRSGGVPSGSVNTNWIDSVANALVIHYAAYKCGSRVRSWYTQGDDGATSFTREVSMKSMAEVLFTDLGMTLSVDKSTYQPNGVHFLQNWHSYEVVGDDPTSPSYGLCLGVRSIMHIAIPMTSYERRDVDDWKRQYDTVRWSQQVLQGIHHPRATQFCDWLYDHDWCVREVIERTLIDFDIEFVTAALTAVARKDGALRFWGFSPGTFLKSPVLQYLGEKVRAARLLKRTNSEITSSLQ